MENWAMNKRSKRRRNKASYYDDLPKELQTTILKRLPSKDLSRAMCVSKSWFQHILFTVFPTILLSTFPFLKTLQRVESRRKLVIAPSWISVFTHALTLQPSPALDQLAAWCKKVADCKFAARKLIDSCNGLLLFVHRSRIENDTKIIYRYYVINPVSKQCMAIVKPKPSAAAYTYAALAYDPAESEFFKVIGFQGLRCVNVFSSKTCAWSSLQFRLPMEVVLGAKWLKNSVYLKGAIYRLSTSGHLIKFLIDQQDNVYCQALAIRVPCSCPLNSCYIDIGLRRKKVVFFMSVGYCLTIWELVERFDGGVYTVNWCQTDTIIDSFIRDLNGYGRLFAIHPYYPIAFFKSYGMVFCYFYCHNTKGYRQEIGNEGPMYRYITTSGFLLLDCPIPHCMDKKHLGTFQWLPTIEDDRKVEVYTLAD